MKVNKIPFEATNFFSSQFLDYINKENGLESFYNLFPTSENFVKQAGLRQFATEKRETLVKSLFQQYSSIPLNDNVKNNIDSLSKSNTFTITTGHQLNLFTGPIYFILKIATVISACKKLNEEQKEINFVPVYWMATEDHDFEEINHFSLFNKKYVWNSEQKGPVGRFNTNGIEVIFEEIKEKLPLFESAYLKSNNLAEATRKLVNDLFGQYGIIIIDGDDASLKKYAVDVFKDELLNNTSHDKVSGNTELLLQKGYKGQVYSREINLFYMENGLRERIVREEEAFNVINTNKTFSRTEILSLLEANPEKFSPNVILRPLYQEVILPNVAYCGGPAEVNYWLQLKSMFDHYSSDFPILIPRNFAMVINKNIASKIDKLNLKLEELFLNEYALKQRFISENVEEDFKLTDEEKELDKLFDLIKDKAKGIDVTLEAFVLAEKQKLKKTLELIEKKMKKAEEQKHETILSQLSNIKGKLFPDGELQERKENFLNFYISDPGFIDKLISSLDPFDFRFNILNENG